MKPAWPTSDMTDGNLWAKGFAAGAAAALVLSVLLGGGTQFEAFVRVAGGGQYLLDARADEPAVSRIVNMPIGALGEAAFVKRSWIVATTYAFTLRLRAEVTSGQGGGVSGLQVTVRLPGRTVSTNATRVAAGTAEWEALPAEALHLRTVAVHWVRVIVLALVLAIGIGAGRRTGSFTGLRRS